jgi:hypothetical protein
MALKAPTPVTHLSSFAIREIIGYESVSQLERDAERNQLPTATFTRDLLACSSVPPLARYAARSGSLFWREMRVPLADLCPTTNLTHDNVLYHA